MVQKKLPLLLFCTLLMLVVASEDNTDNQINTMLQLKESVGFGYSFTNWFLDLIRGMKSPSEFLEFYAEIMTLPGDRIPFRYIKPILGSYAGFIVCLVIGLLFIILMPLVGLIFCCARCCGRCGGRVQLMDAKKDPCRRVFFTICAVLIVTIQVIAVVLAFINHVLLHEALISRDARIGAIPQINSSLVYTESSLKEMFKAAVNSTSVNLDDRKARFMSTVDHGLVELKDAFQNHSKANSVLNSVEELQKTVREFSYGSDTHTRLTTFNSSLDELIQQLPTIRTNIIEILDPNCPYELYSKCQELMHTAQTGLDTRYSMDDFQSGELAQVLDDLHQNAAKFDDLNEFNNTLNRLDAVVKKSIQGSLDQAWTDLAYSPSTREKLASNFATYLDRIYAALNRVRNLLVAEENRDAQEAFRRMVEFRFYGGIALLCIPILILALASLGLCFGTCGHRPYDEAGMCNRGVGANLLLAAVGFIFLFSTILMIVCTVLFLVGAPLQTETCRYLTGHVPDGPRKLDDYVYESVSRVLEKIRRQIRLSEGTPEQDGGSRGMIVKSDLSTLELIQNITRARLTDAVLTRCETEPFVDAVAGGQFTMPILYESVQDILQELLDSIRAVDLNVLFENAVGHCTQTLQQMPFLSKINFTRAINQADLPLTYIEDLEDFAANLQSLGLPALDPPINSLREYAVKVDQMRGPIRHLYTKLDSIPSQRQQLERQLALFSKHLDEAVRMTMDTGLAKFQPLLSQELQLALIATWRNIPCRDLRSAVKGGVDAVCLTVLMPLNAVWAGLGLTLLLFIPLIIFAVKLAGLNRKTENYSSDYEEPDYISYHGFYIRPTSDYTAASKKSRSKKRQHKDNSNAGGPPKRNSKFRSSSQSRYHQVSVYPYDAYE